MSELERELRALAAVVDIPPTPDIASRMRLPAPVRRRTMWPRLAAVVVAVLVVALATSFAVPQARTAILRFFGIGSIRIEFVDRLPEVEPGAPLDLGEEIDLSEAPFPLLGSSLLGDPDRVYLHGHAVTLLYGSPQHVRLLLTQIADSDFTPDIGKKIAGTGTRVEFVPVDSPDEPGLWIVGRQHVVELPGGEPRFAGNTLIWRRGALTLRLEGAARLDQALAIARTLK